MSINRDKTHKTTHTHNDYTVRVIAGRVLYCTTIVCASSEIFFRNKLKDYKTIVLEGRAHSQLMRSHALLL